MNEGNEKKEPSCFIQKKIYLNLVHPIVAGAGYGKKSVNYKKIRRLSGNINLEDEELRKTGCCR